MYSVHIDSSSRYEKSVQIKKDKQTVAEKKGDIDVVVVLKELLTENSIPVEDVRDVSFEKGPGSFTGLKIGSVVRNVLGWALGKYELTDLEYPDYGGEPNIQV